MPSQSKENKQDQIRKITYLILLFIIVLIFTFSGFSKFTNSDELVTQFSKWNLLKWKETIGLIEILAVIVFLFPKTNLIGSILFTCAMLSAIFIHYTHNEPFFFESGIVLVIWINFIIIKPKNR